LDILEKFLQKYCFFIEISLCYSLASIKDTKHKYRFAMHIVISGKHLEVGESLRLHATQFVEKNIKKYFINAINANVTISKEGEAFHTHITVNDGTGTHFLVNGDGNNLDPYKSVDQAVKKIEKQLERYKNRIKNHKKPKYHELSVDAVKYVISDFEEDANIDLTNEVGPTVIAEKQLKVQVLTIRDAVMHMNLQNLPAMLFINAANNKISMVYQRSDNNIAWVDTNIDISTKNI
jgi:ribosomal subunit interface protein